MGHADILARQAVITSVNNALQKGQWAKAEQILAQAKASHEDDLTFERMYVQFRLCRIQQTLNRVGLLQVDALSELDEDRGLSGAKISNLSVKRELASVMNESRDYFIQKCKGSEDDLGVMRAFLAAVARSFEAKAHLLCETQLDIAYNEHALLFKAALASLPVGAQHDISESLSKTYERRRRAWKMFENFQTK